MIGNYLRQKGDFWELNDYQLMSVRYLTIALTFAIGFYLLMAWEHPVSQDTLDLVALGGELSAVVMCFLTARRGHHTPYRATWWCLFMGALLFFMGDCMEVLSDEQATVVDEGFVLHPFFGDVCYLSDSFFLLATVFLYVRRSCRFHFYRLSLEIVITTLAVGAMFFSFIVQPVMEQSALEPDMLQTLVVTTFYPVADVVLIVLLCILIFESGRRVSMQDLLMLGAVCLLFIADQYELYGLTHPNFSLNVVLPLWPASLMMMSSAGQLCVDPNLKLDLPPDPHQQFFLGCVRAALPSVITVVLIILASLRYELSDPLLLWGCVMVFLLALRQGWIAIRHLRLVEALRRSRNELETKNDLLSKLNTRILVDACTDSLTQIHNRRHIEELLEQGVRSPGALGVMVVDVDYFKHINDTYGHQIGDQVLQHIANLLRSSAGEQGSAGRYGGDEFLLVLPGATLDNLSSLQQRLRQDMVSDQLLNRHKVTISMGGACRDATSMKTDSADSGSALLKRADNALYRAKQSGRNCGCLDDSVA